MNMSEASILIDGVTSSNHGHLETMTLGSHIHLT
jgi:hypothetical protein